MAADSSSGSSVTDRRTDLASKPDCSALVGMVSVESVSLIEICLSKRIFLGSLLAKQVGELCVLSLVEIISGGRQMAQECHPAFCQKYLSPSYN